MIKFLENLVHKYRQDSLYRNSVYLMMSALVMSGMGFIFWMINARLFTPEEAGIGSTLISVIGLITSISLLGLNYGIVRFLSSSDSPNDKINTAFTLTALSAVIVSTVFIIGLDIFSPRLSFLRKNLYLSIFFIFGMVVMTHSSLVDSIYVALRRAEFQLIKNTIFSVAKLFLPFILVGFGAMGIFGSWIIASAAGLVTVVLILVRRFDFRFKPVYYEKVVREILPYSIWNYVSSFVSQLPVMVLPLMITNMLEPSITAYYYIAMMIANLLFNIAYSISSSLFAEGSKSEATLGKEIRKSVRILALVVLPAAIIIFFFGNIILLLFGKSYSTEGFQLLRILSFCSVLVCINSLCGTVFRIRHKVGNLIFSNLIYAGVTLVLSYMLISMGLAGIGISIITGYICASISNLWLVGFFKNPKAIFVG